MSAIASEWIIIEIRSGVGSLPTLSFHRFCRNRRRIRTCAVSRSARSSGVLTSSISPAQSDQKVSLRRSSHGKVEQDREHLRGQLDRRRCRPSRIACRFGSVSSISAVRRRMSLGHPHHLARREGGGDGAALAGMLGPVHRDEHRHLDVAVGQEIGERDAAGFGRKDVGQRFDLDDRLVGRDRPIGAVIRIARSDRPAPRRAARLNGACQMSSR